MQNVSLNKCQLIRSIILNGGNSLIFIFLLKALFYYPGILKYLTYLSYCANSIFLFFCLLCDIFIYLKNTDDSKEIEMGYKLLEAKELQWFDKLNDWNRNEFSTVCIPFSFFVTINFWILYFLGESYIKVSSGFYPMTRTFYLHLIITILVLIDIFVSRRKYNKTTKNLGIVVDLFFLYCIIIAVMKYKFNIIPYAFLNLRLSFLICYLIFAYFILLLCCFLNKWLVNYVNEKNEDLYIIID